MAQNVTINGTDYNAVPYLTLDKQGGGTAKFMDTSGGNLDPDLMANTITGYSGGVAVTGYLENRGAGGGTISSKTGTVSIPEGIYTGGGSVSIASAEQAKIITENIKKGVTLLDVAGSLVAGLEYETGTWTPTTDVARGEISWTNAHTEAPCFIMLSDANGTADTTTNTNYSMVYADYYKLFGRIPYASSSYRYGLASYVYRTTSTSQTSAGTQQFSYSSASSTTPSGASYAKYWADSAKFYPYTNRTTTYWRTTRTYKWIAVWKPTS